MMRNQVISRPRSLSRSWQWWPQNQHKLRASSARSRRVCGSCDFDQELSISKESLLTSGEELSDGSSRGSRDPTTTYVPKGFIAVYVGPELRRFVIPTTCLSMPEFRILMDKVEEEFGFEQQGGLQIPCEEEDFEQIVLRCVALHQMSSKNKNKQQH